MTVLALLLALVSGAWLASGVLLLAYGVVEAVLQLYERLTGTGMYSADWDEDGEGP